MILTQRHSDNEDLGYVGSLIDLELIIVLMNGCCANNVFGDLGVTGDIRWFRHVPQEVEVLWSDGENHVQEEEIQKLEWL